MICVYAWRGAMLFIPARCGTGRAHIADCACSAAPGAVGHLRCSRRRRSAAPVINGESDTHAGEPAFSQLTFILARDAVAFCGKVIKSNEVMAQGSESGAAQAEEISFLTRANELWHFSLVFFSRQWVRLISKVYVL
jgi:hypothetical protein